MNRAYQSKSRSINVLSPTLSDFLVVNDMAPVGTQKPIFIIKLHISYLLLIFLYPNPNFNYKFCISNSIFNCLHYLQAVVAPFYFNNGNQPFFQV